MNELETLVSRRLRWSWRVDDGRVDRGRSATPRHRVARERLRTACRLRQRELDRLHPWAVRR
ncbi:hypothetical protein [Kribbella sp. NPDC023855]|uniref:hypothetical protein n=1 Tax=Kribbella sp. NPDC023855 TaxID=3154698 RepID=UPI0033ECEEE9